MLNETGRTYLASVAAPLAAIRRGTRSLLNTQTSTINLAVLPSFGMRWLAPRLPRLTARYPDLVVNIVARSDIFDFAEEDFDAAIHVGPQEWPGTERQPLFQEAVVPVIAPALALEHGVRVPADFLKVRLLAQSERPDDWAKWLSLNGVTPPDAPAISQFSHFLMLAQAVAAGAGAALLPTFLIEPELETGTLIVPLDVPLLDQRVYSLVYRSQDADRPMLTRFREWIAQEAACG